ncbi:hypothetical protein M8J76_000506 [Diaphorina citri]|nr:hypothetical protein M8J75_011606 [Diaphorina citri]KAI5723053.1 hypothetical protein M8J76_000506 [Diaphorina citri]KAI5727863.1 hypothetical protein M8J77_007855 [Diaphorina citri]
MNELQSSWSFLKRLFISEPELPPPPPPPETVYDLVMNQLKCTGDSVLASYEASPSWVLHLLVMLTLGTIFFKIFLGKQPLVMNRLRSSLHQIWPLKRTAVTRRQ